MYYCWEEIHLLLRGQICFSDTPEGGGRGCREWELSCCHAVSSQPALKDLLTVLALLLLALNWPASHLSMTPKWHKTNKMLTSLPNIAKNESEKRQQHGAFESDLDTADNHLCLAFATLQTHVKVKKLALMLCYLNALNAEGGCWTWLQHGPGQAV